MTKQKQIILGVGAVVFHDNCVLLVKRNKPPYVHQWAIPGGKVQFGESLQHAAEREIHEETGIHIEAGDPVYTFEIIDQPDTHYVVVDLQARYLSGTPHANDDAAAAAWIDAIAMSSLDVNPITRELLRTKFNFPGD